MFALDIEKSTLENEDYRRVIYTPGNMQLVLMSLKVGEDIDLEVHPTTDQFFRFERGNGEVIIGQNSGNIIKVKDGMSVIVRHGTYHKVVNTGNVPLKLYTIYSPPEHRFDLVQHTKPLAEDKTDKPEVSLISLMYQYIV